MAHHLSRAPAAAPRWLLPLAISGLLEVSQLRAQTVTSTTTTSTRTSTTTTSTSTSTSSTSTTTRPACTVMVCPEGYVHSLNASSRQCRKNPCAQAVDLETCCDQLCAEGGVCPINFLLKPGAEALRCEGTCDFETDGDRCCDGAAPCASNYTCPQGYASKGGDVEYYCRGAVCDVEDDLDQCCDQACTGFDCSSRSTLKLNAEGIFCAGTCDPLRDRRTCCDLAAALNASAQLLRASLLGEAEKLERLVEMSTEPATAETGFHMPHSAGSTAAHYGAIRGSPEVIEQLAKAGADLAAPDDRGWGALHIAAGRGHAKVVEKLVELRADPLQRALDGRTPREVMEDAVARRPTWSGAPALAEILAKAEHFRAQELHDAAALHIDSAPLSHALPVQHGLRAWLAADVPGSVRTAAGDGAGGGVLRWRDESGRGADAVAVPGAPLPSAGGVGDQINGLPAVSFGGGRALQGAAPLRCVTVALVARFHRVGHKIGDLFSDVVGSTVLRLTTPHGGFWRGPDSDRGLEKKDWQYGNPDKVWLNGDNTTERWEGFPDAPVAIVAERWNPPRPGGRDDFVFQLAGGARGFEGALGEVILFDRALGEEEVQLLSEYLVQKWNISLGAGASTTPPIGPGDEL